MKIGINTCGCNHARNGAGSFLLSFISNLPKSDEYSFEILGLEEDRFIYTSGTELSYISVLNDKNASKIISKNQYEAVLFPAPEKCFIKCGKAKSVVLINYLYSVLKDKKQRKILKKNLKKADYIIAFSEIIKKDLVENGFSESSIRVVHNGLDHKIFYPVLNLDSDILDIKPFAIKRPYFIYCSSISGVEKNHLNLVKAFEIFKEKTGLPQRLVIAGNDGEYSEVLHKAAFDSSCAEDIFITGYFQFESLAKLYAGSDACIFPARNEGVGMPVLEAMACGVPVICSNSGALPEIGGDAPLYFDPDDINEMASLMEKVVQDQDLRSEMIRKGADRVSTFNWETTVAETLNVLK
ncbi:MAG: glycosyltransferase family 4 protein [Treponema sp.]|nr:glycosyltransferase family 4 protein [Treponema sp.]